MKLLASEFRRQTVLKVLGRAQTEKKLFLSISHFSRVLQVGFWRNHIKRIVKYQSKINKKLVFIFSLRLIHSVWDGKQTARSAAVLNHNIENPPNSLKILSFASMRAINNEPALGDIIFTGTLTIIYDQAILCSPGEGLKWCNKRFVLWTPQQQQQLNEMSRASNYRG